MQLNLSRPIRMFGLINRGYSTKYAMKTIGNDFEYLNDKKLD